MRLLLIAAVVACLCLPSAVAVAQGYPPPQPTPKKTHKPKPKCNTPGVLKKDGKKTVFKAKTNFQRGEKMVVKGAKGCSGDRKKVKLVITTHDGPNIGTGKSSSSGAYTIRGTIPTTAKYGKHRLEAWTSGKKYPAAINIVSSSGRGGSSRRSFVTSTPMLAGWVALGAFLVAFFLGSRRRRNDPMLATAADLEVPLIDTSHFVPAPVTRPRRRSSAKATKPKGNAKAKTNGKPAGARKATKPRAAKPKVEAAGGKVTKPKSQQAAKGSVTGQRKETRAPKARTATKPQQPKNGKKN